MTAVQPFRPTRLPLLALLVTATAATAQLAGPQSSLSPYGTTNRLMSASPLLTDANDPAEALARYLRVLSDNPRDLGALTGAGHAALAIGDANAALAFYARAEEIAPRDGRIKAGLGSAMLQLEKPKEAIGLFDEATDLGVADADIASDRGLAWDLRGDARRAQRDYALALKARPDDETTRRMALSLAISGDAAGANALLDPLLRRQDRAAWRARAFILAMSGDIAKADVVARSAMSPAQVAALHPFLTRLGALRPAQKALAVNFGEMPSDGRAYSQGELAAIDGQPPIQLGSGLIPAGEPWGPRRDGGMALDAESDEAPIANAPRRRPGHGDVAAPADRSMLVAEARDDRTPFAARFQTASAAAAERKTELAQASTDRASAAAVRSRIDSARPRPGSSPRPAPVIVMAAAAAPPPTFLAAAAPPPAVSAAQPSSDAAMLIATPPARASEGPSPSLSALEPAIEERARAENANAPRPEQLAANQAANPAVPVPLDASIQDKPVALPEVGYKLPPAAAKRPPAEAPALSAMAPTKKPAEPPAEKPHAAVKPKGAADSKAGEGGKKSGSAKARADEGDDEAEGAKAKRAAAKPAARKAGSKVEADDAKDEDDKSSSTKVSTKSASARKDKGEDKHAAAGKADDAKDEDDKSSSKKASAKSASAKKGEADKGDDKRAAVGKTDAAKKDVAKKDVGKKTTADDGKAASKKGSADGDKDAKASAKKDDGDKGDAKPAKGAAQRVWVQVAGGATKADLPKAWGRLKGKAPALAKGQSVYTTPLKATNRLLVGPFKSADEAQAYVNKMGKTGMSGFTFTSDKGQQVDKLSTDK